MVSELKVGVDKKRKSIAITLKYDPNDMGLLFTTRSDDNPSGYLPFSSEELKNFYYFIEVKRNIGTGSDTRNIENIKVKAQYSGKTKWIINYKEFLDKVNLDVPSTVLTTDKINNKIGYAEINQDGWELLYKLKIAYHPPSLHQHIKRQDSSLLFILQKFTRILLKGYKS